MTINRILRKVLFVGGLVGILADSACDPGKEDDEREKVSCTKDSECKGDRVCDSDLGYCVDSWSGSSSNGSGSNSSSGNGSSSSGSSSSSGGAGGNADIDICEKEGLYGNGNCDDFCPKPDPDCENQKCGNSPLYGKYLWEITTCSSMFGRHMLINCDVEWTQCTYDGLKSTCPDRFYIYDTNQKLDANSEPFLPIIPGWDYKKANSIITKYGGYVELENGLFKPNSFAHIPRDKPMDEDECLDLYPEMAPDGG